MKKRSDETPEIVQDTQENSKKLKKDSKNAALVYSIVLFVFVMIIMTLSYFIQQRHNNATISDLTEQHSEFSIQALENIEDLQQRNRALEASLEDAEDRVMKLEAELEQAKLDWAEDVQNVEDTLKTDVNEAIRQRDAVQKLLDLYAAVESGGDASAALEAAEPYAGYFDGAYAELYESLKQRLE